MKKLSIVVSAFVLFSLVACTRDNVEEKQQILLKSQEFVLEYGESVSKNAGYYLDNDETFLENVSLESYVVNESKEKNYPKVGEYEISLIYGEQTEKVKIIVKDTRAPEFVDIKDKYEVDYNKF